MFTVTFLCSGSTSSYPAVHYQFVFNCMKRGLRQCLLCLSFSHLTNGTTKPRKCSSGELEVSRQPWFNLAPPCRWCQGGEKRVSPGGASTAPQCHLRGEDGWGPVPWFSTRSSLLLCRCFYFSQLCWWYFWHLKFTHFWVLGKSSNWVLASGLECEIWLGLGSSGDIRQCRSSFPKQLWLRSRIG